MCGILSAISSRAARFIGEQQPPCKNIDHQMCERERKKQAGSARLCVYIKFIMRQPRAFHRTPPIAKRVAPKFN